MNADDIKMALKTKFAEPAYAFFMEVGDRTGGRSRSADGIAMGLWPSRGIFLTGFEIKVSRADWRSELKNPAKADMIARYCHEWYIVTPDLDIVRPGEMPTKWGHMIATARGIRIEKPAMFDKEAQPLTCQFVAAILRAAQKVSVSDEILKAMYNKGFNAGIENAKSQQPYATKHTEIELDRLRKSLKEFEEASGIEIGGWKHTSKSLGEAVKKIADMKQRDFRITFRRTIVQMRENAEIMQKILETYDGEEG